MNSLLARVTYITTTTSLVAFGLGCHQSTDSSEIREKIGSKELSESGYRLVIGPKLAEIMNTEMGLSYSPAKQNPLQDAGFKVEKSIPTTRSASFSDSDLPPLKDRMLDPGFTRCDLYPNRSEAKMNAADVSAGESVAIKGPLWLEFHQNVEDTKRYTEEDDIYSLHYTINFAFRDFAEHFTLECVRDDYDRDRLLAMSSNLKDLAVDGYFSFSSPDGFSADGWLQNLKGEAEKIFEHQAAKQVKKQVVRAWIDFVKRQFGVQESADNTKLEGATGKSKHGSIAKINVTLALEELYDAGEELEDPEIYSAPIDNLDDPIKDYLVKSECVRKKIVTILSIMGSKEIRRIMDAAALTHVTRINVGIEISDLKDVDAADKKGVCGTDGIRILIGALGKDDYHAKGGFFHVEGIEVKRSTLGLTGQIRKMLKKRIAEANNPPIDHYEEGN